MNPVTQTLVVTGVLMALVFSIIAMVATLFLTRRMDTIQRYPTPREAAARRRHALNELTNEAIEAGSYDQPAPPPDEVKPVPVDPNHPPQIRTYTGPSHTHRCRCHDQFIESGEQVIWWPRPDLAEGAVELYHPSAAQGRA